MSGSAAHWRVQAGGALRGRLKVPGDKSISHRAVMFAALAQGTSHIQGFLEGEDCLCTLKAFQSMGVQVEQPAAGRLVIRGAGLDGLRASRDALDMGNSGTGMRLMAGLLAGQRFESRLIGDASLSRRPMARVVEPLRRMGASIDTAEGGRAPLVIHPVDALRAIEYDSPVASAQIKSAILLAGLHAHGRTCVREPGASRDHTERLLQSFGARVEIGDGYAALEGGQALSAVDLTVPADLSSAAFFLVGASVAQGSDLLLEAVGVNPTRTGVIEILRRMGASIEIVNPRQAGREPVADLRVRSARLKGTDIDRELVVAAIDEFPVLFVAAALAEGVTRVRGAEELRVKESDRIQAMCDGLQALGIEATPAPDGATIRGGRLQGGRIDSHGDHRVAMAFAVAALGAAAPLEILDIANVATSFPGFVDQAQTAGLRIDPLMIPA